MGTATYTIHHTRSQSRKARSASGGELKDRELSSPLEVIHGSIITTSSKRQCLRINNAPTTDNADDKENAIPSSTGLRDASQGLERKGAAKAIQKGSESGSAANHSKRHRSRPENSKDNNAATPANGSSSTPAANECENERGASSTVCPSDGSLNQKPTCVARSPVNLTNFGTISNIDTGFCTRPSQENCHNRPSLAMRDSPSPVGENGERKSCADCTVSERHEVPSAQPQPGALASPVGTNGERRPTAGCKAIAKMIEAPTLRPHPAKDSKDFSQNVGSSLPGASPLALLKEEYEKLYQKYQKLKARRFDEVDEVFKDQNSRISAFIKATEALRDHYKGENNLLKHQLEDANVPDLLKRCRWLEKANLECRNDFLLEQAKNLELQQEIESLKSLFVDHSIGKARNCTMGSKLTLDELEEVGEVEDMTRRKTEGEASSVLRDQTKLMQQLLEGLLGLKLRFCEDGIDTQLQFQHGPSGFSFNLKPVQDTDIAHLVGGGELMYQNVSSGTLCRKAADWMTEDEILFGIAQVQFLFKKLQRFLHQGA